MFYVAQFFLWSKQHDLGAVFFSTLNSRVLTNMYHTKKYFILKRKYNVHSYFTGVFLALHVRSIGPRLPVFYGLLLSIYKHGITEDSTHDMHSILK